MKKIIIILALVIGMTACENQEWNFPDYDYTSGYFPYQFPVRTLVLGDYIFDNANDNNHLFKISATMGGVYKNEKDRVFSIQYAPELAQNVLFKAGTKDTVRLMPQAYYTLSSSTQLVIPKGEMSGGIDVQLTDAFFTDPLSIKNTYVVPLKLTGSNDVDTILQGFSYKTNPDPRVTTAGEWEKLPKNFTMFAVKFINEYHGKYLHRGVNTVKEGGSVVQTNVYRNQYIERNEIWSLATAGRNKVTVTGLSHSTLLTGSLKMDLAFDASGNCTITKASTAAPSDYEISGTGKFVNDADNWGDKLRDAIHMSYTFTQGQYTFSATDTLVIRDRGVVMEVYQPAVFAPVD